MPEQLKPCPFCGCQPTLRESAYYGSGEYLASINCPCINGDVAESYFLRSGETQQQATNKSIAAWNTRTESMPRALTWSKEPPRVPGKHYQRFWFGDHWGEPDIITVDESSIGKIRRNDDVQWAGPIAPPGEQK